MNESDYACSLERQLTAARAELAAVRADLERAVRDRAVLLDACKQAVYAYEIEFPAADETMVQLKAAIRTTT